MVGIFPRASSCQAFDTFGAGRRWLLGHLHSGHVLHFLALLIAGILAALVPLLLLFVRSSTPWVPNAEHGLARRARECDLRPQRKPLGLFA
jgi:hypothetical protein